MIWLPHPCLLGPKKGRKWYVTPAISGVPNTKRGDTIRSGYVTPAFSGAQKRAAWLQNPFSGVPNAKRDEKIRSGITSAFSGIPNTKRGETIMIGYLTPYLLKGAKEGGIATQSLNY